MHVFERRSRPSESNRVITAAEGAARPPPFSDSVANVGAVAEATLVEMPRQCQQLIPFDYHISGKGAPPPPPPPFPAAKSDAVAEAALGALAALLDAATPQSAETVVPLLERVLRAAALPRASASEEVWLCSNHTSDCGTRATLNISTQNSDESRSTDESKSSPVYVTCTEATCCCAHIQALAYRCAAEGFVHWRRRYRASDTAPPWPPPLCRRRKMRRWSATWPPAYCRWAALVCFQDT